MYKGEAVGVFRKSYSDGGGGQLNAVAGDWESTALMSSEYDCSKDCDTNSHSSSLFGTWEQLAFGCGKETNAREHNEGTEINCNGFNGNENEAKSNVKEKISLIH